MSAPPVAVIAVVDDDPALRALLDELLTAEGYRVVTERGAERAIAFITRERPALVILDLWLRGDEEAGIQLVRGLRATSEGEKLPVIVCSAAAHVLARRGDELRAAGCIILPKPFHLDELLACVAEMLPAPQ